MKKQLVIFTILFIFISAVFAEESIYSFISNVKSNPSQYTLILGSNADDNEIKAAVELAAFLRITSSSLDKDVTKASNLIVLGTMSSNSLISSYLGESASINSEMIKVVNNNLILTGRNSNDVQKAVSIIKSYESNKKLLQKELFVPSSFFRMTNPIVWIFIVLIIIALPILIILTEKKRQPDFFDSIKQKLQAKAAEKKEAKEQKIVKETKEIKTDTENYELLNYIKNNLNKGHSKEELKSVLINAGWDKSAVEKAIKKF